MSYPELGVDGEINPCYFFLRELEHCFHNHLYPTTDCKSYREDFLECHNRNKQVSQLVFRLNL